MQQRHPQGEHSYSPAEPAAPEGPPHLAGSSAAPCHDDSPAACNYLTAVHSVLHTPYKLALERLGPLDNRRSVLVAFEIQQDGSLASLAVVRSSGSERFDQAALTALRSAAPYPRPPASLLTNGLTQVSWWLGAGDTGCGIWNARVTTQRREVAAEERPGA